MKKNVGKIDKIIRFMVAIIFILLIITKIATGIWFWILGALALIFIATGIMGWCGIYSVFGITTCSLPKK